MSKPSLTRRSGLINLGFGAKRPDVINPLGDKILCRDILFSTLRDADCRLINSTVYDRPGRYTSELFAWSWSRLRLAEPMPSLLRNLLWLVKAEILAAHHQHLEELPDA